jgi:single-strand DNA-binding protein
MLNNRIILKGNLTRDPEYKNVNEKELVSFRVAVNESLGSNKEETTYFDVDGWNQSSYAQSVLLSKGDRVFIDGRVRQREWTDKNGTKRVSYSVIPVSFSKLVKPTITS